MTAYHTRGEDALLMGIAPRAQEDIILKEQYDPDWKGFSPKAKDMSYTTVEVPTPILIPEQPVSVPIPEPVPNPKSIPDPIPVPFPTPHDNTNGSGNLDSEAPQDELDKFIEQHLSLVLAGSGAITLLLVVIMLICCCRKTRYVDEADDGETGNTTNETQKERLTAPDPEAEEIDGDELDGEY